MTDPSPRFLDRIALGRPELRAWAMYDWANSAMVTIIIGAVFPVYFTKVAAAELPGPLATQRFALATTLSLVLVAVASPILGALADAAGIKKKLLGLFMTLGVAATALMFFIDRGEWRFAAALFVAANIGVAGSFVFYDALLPHVARRDEIDRLSTTGYALGYLGGGLLLALNLAWIQKPEWFGLPSGPGLTDAQSTLPVRLSFLSVALWWLVFAIPLFRRVGEPPRLSNADAHPGRSLFSATFVSLARTFRDLRRFRQALLMLVAFLIYNDGIGTIIRMAASYGTELRIGQGAVIGAFLLVQFIGIPFAIAFGALASRIGAKRAIFVSLVVYAGISVLGYFMKSAREFYALAVLVGMVQGGSQALSRSLFASMIPRERSAEFFGLFSIFEKFAGIIGPAIFAATIAMTGSSRNAILSVIAFFIVGGVLLARVNVEEGRRAAREAEQEEGAR